jgi:regulator of RNase E activity RraA
MKPWKNDNELFEIARAELFVAVVGDAMDKLGYTHQFLPPAIQPLRDDMVVIGRAMPVLEADCFEEADGSSFVSEHNPMMNRPFGLMLEALDDLRENEIYICSGSSPHYALWGEIMSTCAQNRGCKGAVVNGYSRDTNGILAIDFPTFSYGRYAQDQGPRGRVIDFRCPIEMDGVRINPGDIIFGDVDGVCVIPAEVEEEVFVAALEKARGEKLVLEAVQKGMGAVEAWNTYGIM